jgi:Flp pilus assembly pilin Flp
MDVLKMIERLVPEDDGATMVEYAIMIGFIAALCVVAVTALGLGVSDIFVVPGFP